MFQENQQVESNYSDLFSKISQLSSTIKALLERKSEPVQDIRQLNYLLDAHFEDVWKILTNPSLVDHQPLPDAQGNPQDLKTEFYSNVLAGITELMLNELSVQKQEYMNELQLFFKIIISKFFGRDTGCAQLATICANLFDVSHNLHQRAFKSYQNEDYRKMNYNLSNLKKRVDSQSEWRLSLKPGDQVDVVKSTQLKGGITLQGWNRGTVVAVASMEQDAENQMSLQNAPRTLENQYVQILYEKDRSASQASFKLDDFRIAPLGTHTADFSWRYELEVNDNIDCMDEEKEWYKSTIMDKRIVQNQNQEDIIQILVGFRTYEPEGSKNDERGQYFGWSDRYDAWYWVTDTQVQKFHTCHNQYVKVEQANKQYEKNADLEDRNDLLLSGAFATERDKLIWSHSYVISDALNEFGEAGGFDRILDEIQSAKLGIQSVSIDKIYSLMSFVANTQPLWHRQFAIQYVDRVNQALLEGICFVNPEVTDSNYDTAILGPLQFKEFACETLDNTVNHFLDPTWKRTFTLEHCNKQINTFKIWVGAAMLSLPNLKKRISGIKYINCAIRQVRQIYSQHRGMNTKELIWMMRERNVIDTVFGESTHYQIVNRSADIIRLLFNEKEITESDLDLLWNLCHKQGEQIKLEIYKIVLDVLKATYNCMTDNMKSYFLDKIAALSPDQFISQDIELIIELGKKAGVSFRQPEGYVLKAAKLLWNIAIREANYPIETCKMARKKFCEIVQSWDDTYKEEYCGLCLDKISEGKLPLQHIKIAIKMIERMNNNSYQNNQKKTRQEFAEDLVTLQEFDQMIINDLDSYISFVNSLVKKGEVPQPKQDVSENHPFSHHQNVKSRLNRLRTLLCFSKGSFKTEQLIQIWDILLVKSELKDQDQTVFFSWLKTLFDKQNRRMISDEVLINLFNQTVLTVDLNMLKRLNRDGLDCIISMFAIVNEKNNFLIDLEPKTESYTSWNSNNDNSSQYKLKAARFRVHVMPDQLEGVKILWQVLANCDSNNQTSILPVTQKTLINIYTHLSPELQVHQDLISQSFVQECLNCLNNLSKPDSAKTEAQKKESFKCIAQMLSKFFEGSEQNGIGQMTLHRQLEESNSIKKLLIEAKIPIRRGIDANFLEVNCSAAMTVWQLQTLVAQYTNTSPLCIQLKRADSKKQEIKEFEKLLSDLNIANSEEINVIRAPHPEVNKVPLLDSFGKVVPELKTIISEWFMVYSQDLSKQEILDLCLNGPKDGYPTESEIEELPDYVRGMTKFKCASFAEAITAMSNITPSDHRVQFLFEKYSKTLGNGQIILEQELQNFYQDQAVTKDEVVRQNLKHQGIGNDLKPIVDYSCLTLNSDQRLKIDSSQLPRSKLSQTDSQFKFLLSLVENSAGDEAESIWTLIQNLPTNQTIEAEILENRNMNEILTIQDGNLYQVLYCLQIIQSLVFEYKHRQPDQVTVHLQDLAGDAQQSNAQGAQQVPMSVETYHENFPTLDQMDSANSPIAQNERDTQVAIPLPYNGPFLHNQGSSTQKSSSYDVPMAPASAAAAIGPPNANNTMSQHQSLKDFKGISETIEFDFRNRNQNSEQRKEWLPNFLADGGLEKLMTLLKNLSLFHFQRTNEIQDNVLVNSEQEKPSQNKNRVVKKCLTQLMSTIKFLLIGTFSANENNSGLAIELMRKMSSTFDEKQDTKQKNAMLEEQQNTQTEIKPLIDLLKSRLDLQDYVQNLKLQNFQIELQTIIASCLKKDKIPSGDDIEIGMQGVSIWMHCIASDPELLNELYKQFAEVQQNKSGPHLMFAAYLVERGLLNGSYRLRESFANAISFIVRQIKSPKLTQLPLNFFLGLLFEKLSYVESQPEVSKSSKWYFTLFKELLTSYLKNQQLNSIYEPQHLFLNLVNRLYSYVPIESKLKTYTEDYTLVGFLELITILIQKEGLIATEDQLINLTEFILNKCLFGTEFSPIEQDITSEVNLESIEKRNINTCHSKNSIASAYELFLAICKTQKVPDLPFRALQYFIKQVNAVDKPQKPGFAPDQNSRYRGHCGIKNLGAVCYMNSMMQQFYHIPTFRHCLLGCQDTSEANLVMHENSLIHDHFLHQMMKMFGFLQLSDRQFYNPKELCFSFKSFDNEPTNVREQKDAHEFLNLCFDRLENLLKNTSQKYLIQNVFGGSTRSMMTCKNCGFCKARVEDFYNLQLEVKNANSIQDGLKKFTTGEIINEYKCENCNQKVDLEKKTAIDKLPNTLIVHLQRIVFDFDTMRNNKLNDRVEFPQVLNLKEFTTQEILKKDAKLKKNKTSQVQEPKLEDSKQEEQNVSVQEPQVVEEAQDEMASDNENSGLQSEEDFEFKLVGIVCHMGSADAGHYLSYINVNRQEGQKEEWLELNDTTVQGFSEKMMEENCFGGQLNNNQNAYMLVYDKQIKNKIKVVLANEVVEAALACDSTATTSAKLNHLHLFTLFPQLKENLPQAIQFDDEKKEHYALVEFESAKKFVPNSIYRMVHADNLKFLSEKQVFQDSFYKCTQQLLELCIFQGDSSSRFQVIFELLDKVIFDLMVNSAANQSLKQMTDLLLVLLAKSDDAVLHLVQKRVFAAKESLGADEKNFFEMLGTHQEKEVRELAARTLTLVLNRLIHMGYQAQLIESIVKGVLDLMPNECQKHWQRLDTYFTFIYDLSKSSIPMFHVLVQQNTVAKLMDLLSKYHPNAMLYQTAVPPFEYLVKTVAFIVRCFPCIVDPESMPPNEEMDRATLSEMLAADRGKNKYYHPWQSFNLNEAVIEINNLTLSETCVNALFMHTKAYKLFYANASKHGFALEEYSRLLAHLCFKNKEFSRRIAKHILKGTNKSSADEVGPYLEIMKQFLLIEDEYQPLRLEWVFGIADFIVKSTTSYQIYNSLPKVGVANADTIGAPVCRYFSPVLKAASSTYNSKESALQALLTNRRSQSQAVLFSLKSILEAILEDPKKVILNYLQTMDPPTYQYARYWDWIKPWVSSEVDSNKKNQHIAVFRAELELSINVLSLIEQVESEQRQSMEGGGPPQGDIICYPVNDGGPKAYLIWEMVSQETVDQRENKDEGLILGINRATCTVSMSMPTGDDNFALMDTYASKNNLGYQNIQGGGTGNISKRSYGRGQGNTRRYIQGRQNRLKTPTQLQQPKRQKEKHHSYKQDDADSEDESLDEMAMQDTTGGDSHMRKVQFGEENETIIEANNAPVMSMDNADILIDQQEDQEMQPQELEVAPQDHDEQMQDQSNPADRFEDAHIKDEEESSPKDPELSQHLQNMSLSDFPSECLLSFKVQNNASFSKQFMLQISPAYDENGQPLPVNFKMPQSEILCEVYSNSSKYVVHFTKLDPQADWGVFEWTYRVVQKEKNYSNIAHPATVSTWNTNTTTYATGDTGNYYQNDIQSSNVYDYVENTTGGNAASNEKSCPVCTYLNPAHYLQCEICQSNL